MAKKIRIITNQIVFPSGAWVLNATPNPGSPTGYYALSGDVSSVITGSIEITGNQFFQLYDDSDVYIGDYALGQLDLPQGLVVSSIAQGPLASGHDGIPQGNVSGGLTTYPALTSGGATITSWNAGILAISDTGFTYVPATMSYYFLNGYWKLTINVSIPMGVTGLRVICASQTGLAIKGISPQISIPSELDDTPLMIYEGIWDSDPSLCPVIDAPIVTIVDPVTGEFSWIYPVGSSAVVIKIEQTGHDDVFATVASPTTNYIPSGVYGHVTVTVMGVTTFPVCYGSETSFTLDITTPYDYTMGSEGTGARGVDLGGAATLQLVVNPSGIYTLVKDKTNDTLYERVGGVATSQDVKIPDPFIKSAFFGD